MSNTITIWQRYDRDTTPRGFGRAPSYHIEKPYTNDTEMIWADPVTITIPDGYTIAANNYGDIMLFDTDNCAVDIVDDHGHPAIVIGAGTNKGGKRFARYKRLDK